jgi:2-polyprenyl-3-methyl-5-hydroxy-6-metoxy-1,4-benzoquinol methylase
MTVSSSKIPCVVAILIILCVTFKNVLNSEADNIRTQQQVYIYQDLSDEGIEEILSNLESRVPASEGGRDPEIIGWQKLDGIVRGHVKESRDRNPSVTLKMLDAGCGFGRLMVRYCQYFEACMCVEPDIARLRVAQAYGVNISQATFRNTGAQLFRSQDKYDVVLSSQVVQHVPLPLAREIFSNLVKLTADDGVTVVLSTHFPDLGRPVFEVFCAATKNATCMPHPVSRNDFEDVFYSGKVSWMACCYGARGCVLMLVCCAICSYLAACSSTLLRLAYYRCTSGVAANWCSSWSGRGVE